MTAKILVSTEHLIKQIERDYGVTLCFFGQDYRLKCQIDKLAIDEDYCVLYSESIKLIDIADEGTEEEARALKRHFVIHDIYDHLENL